MSVARSAYPVNPNANGHVTLAEIKADVEYRAWLKDMRARRDQLVLEGRRGELLGRVFALAMGRELNPYRLNETALAASYFDSPEKVLGWMRPAFSALMVEATTPPPRDVEAEARAAVASGRASALPTVEGKGLSAVERSAVLGAVHRAVFAAGIVSGSFSEVTPAARLAGQVAGRVALRAVLDLRPRPEVDAWDRQYDDASQWPEDTDSDVWGVTEPAPEPTPDGREYGPSPEDVEWAAAAFAAGASLDSGLSPADWKPVRRAWGRSQHAVTDFDMARSGSVG